MKKEKSGNLKRVSELIEKTTKEPSKLIAVPSELIHFVGNTHGAVFLSQLIYWSDKGGRSDGYIYKTKKEWGEETGLSDSQVTRFTREFKDREFLETSLKKANGSPTVHYKLDIEKLLDSIQEFLVIRYLEKSRNESPETIESLTDSTSEITQDIFIEREALSLNKNKVTDSDEIRLLNVRGGEPSTDLSGSLNGNSAETNSKITIPMDFEPTLEELFKAAVTFPSKSPSYVTEKFKKYFSSNSKKLTNADWHSEWWNWMNGEYPSHANELVEGEIDKIKNEFVTVIYRLIQGLVHTIFDAEYLFDNQVDGMTQEAIELALEELSHSYGVLHRIEEDEELYYFDLRQFQNEESFRNRLYEEANSMGIEIPDNLDSSINC